ncbi:MAG: hypothetical protein LBI64_07280 [Coriobacteriales bacterium]|nr:hypothetical protein [Coriobacteriales bacterium]
MVDRAPFHILLYDAHRGGGDNDGYNNTLQRHFTMMEPPIRDDTIPLDRMAFRGHRGHAF